MISWFKKRWENFFISSNQKKQSLELVFTSAKKLEFNLSRNNSTLAEFLVFEILGYLLRLMKLINIAWKATNKKVLLFQVKKQR